MAWAITKKSKISLRFSRFILSLPQIIYEMAIDKVKYWMDLADYDIEVAELMHTGGRWLYVGFMCHQVIEKSLKAYWNSVREDEPPYIHNVKNLAVSCGLYTKMDDEQKMFLDILTPLNIEARYPSYKERLANSLSEEKAKDIIDKTKTLQLWIKQKLSNLQKDIKA
jgi:HEPN domain-containing protein